MCGIAGILLAYEADPRHLAPIGAMVAALAHRGPDGEGIWLDRESGIALGHRRLAILDLSDAGQQPMLSHDEALVMTFNGEIYNFAALRSRLEATGHRFRGGSDTEVMLAAFEDSGIEQAPKQFSGMFAAGIWDRNRRVLHLVRDRMGKKPLYVALSDGALLFASELKAILAHPNFVPVVDDRALGMMLRQGWVPDECCIWKGVFKLPPGTMLSVRAEDLKTTSPDDLRKRARRWWSLAAIVEAGQQYQLNLNADQLDAELDALLRSAVRRRMIADVPLGAFLSGGIDSSVIVALMQAQSSRPIHTFTIGFAEAQYDEAAYASDVARHFHTEHTEFRVTPAEARALIPELPQVWDEPFADESQIPTLLLSRLAREHVTVALSGDGGDEGFGGYARHFMLDQLSALFALPLALRRLLASVLLRLTPQACATMLQTFDLPASTCRSLSGVNLQKFARALMAAGERERYDQLTTFEASALVCDWTYPDVADAPKLLDATAKAMYRDTAGYLTGDILVKLDRATMAVGLEARCPFLDERVVEFAWRLPTAAKVCRGQGKRPLRRILRRYLPESLFDRPKQGFNVPIGEWLRGPLRGWAAALLDDIEIRREGLLDPDRVQSCWQQHLKGEVDRSGELWAILMAQAWLNSALTRRSRHSSSSAFSDTQIATSTATSGSSAHG